MVRHTRRDVLKLSGGLLGGIAVGSTVTAATSTERFVVQAEPADLGDDLSLVHEMPGVKFVAVEGDESAVSALGADYAPDIELQLSEPIQSHVTELEDEPMYGYQWDKPAINAPGAHHYSRGDGARIAIVDSGVDANHPDLAPNMNNELSRNFTDDGMGPGPYGGDHGTHVAGIAAASDRNDVGIGGTAPDAEIVDCRVFSSEPGASFADILAANVYAANIGCDVINMSLGAYPVPRQGLGEFYGKVLNYTMAYVRRQGSLVVASAGNDGADLQHDGSLISLPNEASNVMSIAATGPIGYMWGEEGLREEPWSHAFYTNYGTNAISLSAPGGDADLDAIGTGVAWYLDLVFSTLPNGGYGWKAGTSMAAPNVAGAAALVASQMEKKNANKVKKTLCNSARDVGNKEYHGAGFLDAEAAVKN
ncbi:S8 family serine peptidase [Haloarchaeobius sp. TZWWS8]|uniref:S8 family serine peptidase n=1 Tax=Haloarchaeobius sp. TZWWS8 TaxID=3446121 RepID=UPI003EBA2C18